MSSTPSRSALTAAAMTIRLPQAAPAPARSVSSSAIASTACATIMSLVDRTAAAKCAAVQRTTVGAGFRPSACIFLSIASTRCWYSSPYRWSDARSQLSSQASFCLSPIRDRPAKWAS